MTISNAMTVIGLVNGMIGGIILVMPLLALKTGWFLILPITLFSGFVSYFTCLLCIRHLRNFKNLDTAIYYHFGKKVQYKVFYDVIIIVSMTTLLVLYFSLICEQWAGIVGQSKVISIINALMLFPIVYVMKKYDFGATLLAYGILSIVGYVMFLIWLTLTTEDGPKQIPATHPNFVDLAAALAQGFAIQTFFIPILRKNPNQKHYKKLLGLTYIIGALIYTFIGYSGAYCIVNRTAYKDPQTIEDYFGNGSSWQVILVQIIYLVHLYSAFPQFLLIAKSRFFSIFKWPQPRDVSIKEVIYVGVTIFLCLAVKLTEMSVTTIIELNGSIISFFFIYVIPIGLHVKCVYFTDKEQRHLMLNEEKQKREKGEGEGEQEEQEEQNEQQVVQQQMKQKSIQSESNPSHNSNQPNNQKPNIELQMLPAVSQQPNYQPQPNPSQQPKIQNPNPNPQPQCQCGCDIQFKSKLHQYSQGLFLIIMSITGLMIMIYTIYLLINEEKEE